MRSYANALEEWDDMVGENWDEPESEFLNPHQWIYEDEWYVNQ
jgi:dynein heavy chain